VRAPDDAGQFGASRRATLTARRSCLAHLQLLVLVSTLTPSSDGSSQRRASACVLALLSLPIAAALHCKLRALLPPALQPASEAAAFRRAIATEWFRRVARARAQSHGLTRTAVRGPIPRAISLGFPHRRACAPC
jgi:hypothetical protein